MDELRPLNLEQFKVVNDFPGVGIHAQREQLFGIGGRGGEPDLFFPNHGGRPSLAVNGGFPFNVLLSVPDGGQLMIVCVAVAIRSAELRPVGSRDADAA